jgi:uracil phosphoribosyltransferase
MLKQFPPDIQNRYVLLLDPMLGRYYSSGLPQPTLTEYIATGGSAIKAVEVLKEHGVPEERIIFINLVRALLNGRCRIDDFPNQVSAPEGLKTFCSKFPLLRVVCWLPIEPDMVLIKLS